MPGPPSLSPYQGPQPHACAPRGLGHLQAEHLLPTSCSDACPRRNSSGNAGTRQTAISWTLTGWPAPPTRPWSWLFHGLEGSAHSHYGPGRPMFGMLRARGWRGVLLTSVVAEARPTDRTGLITPGTLPKSNGWLRTVASKAPQTRRFAVGVSLGGNALLKWLAWAGAGALDSITAAAAVSAPMDLATAGHRLGRGAQPAVRMEFPAHAQAARACSNWNAFQDCTTPAPWPSTFRCMPSTAWPAPLHGFRDTELTGPAPAASPI